MTHNNFFKDHCFFIFSIGVGTIKTPYKCEVYNCRQNLRSRCFYWCFWGFTLWIS